MIKDFCLKFLGTLDIKDVSLIVFLHDLLANIKTEGLHDRVRWSLFVYFLGYRSITLTLSNWGRLTTKNALSHHSL